MVRTYVCVRFYLCPLDWSLFRTLMHWLVNAWVIWNSSDVIGVFLKFRIHCGRGFNIFKPHGLLLQ